LETQEWTVAVGDDTTSAVFERAGGPLADTVLVLGHGASTSREHPTMGRLAAAFLAEGISVVRFNSLYTEKKKGPPDRMPRLTECFGAVVERTRGEVAPRKLIIGGHSMGGRAASMMAAESFPCNGVLLLSYPLHPAGQPEKLRDAHLSAINVPALCMNGTRDELCRKDLMEAVVAKLPPTFIMHWIDGADHGYRVQKRSGRTEDDVFAEIGRNAREWLERANILH
jgi:predicted alpha/beta-hydrolase family hydrolase